MAQRFETIPQQESFEQYFRDLAYVYWDFGISQSSFYQLMFEGLFPNSNQMERPCREQRLH